MIFRLYDCDVGIKLNGVNYDFTHVDEVTVEDPEFNRLSRGANAGNKEGLVYKEGLKEPKRITIAMMQLTAALYAALVAAFEAQTRLDVFAVSRTDGSKKMGRNAILCQIPQQLTLNDSAESMQVRLVFETFDTTEDHKS